MLSPPTQSSVNFDISLSICNNLYILMLIVVVCFLQLICEPPHLFIYFHYVSLEIRSDIPCASTVSSFNFFMRSLLIYVHTRSTESFFKLIRTHFLNLVFRSSSSSMNRLSYEPRSNFSNQPNFQFFMRSLLIYVHTRSTESFFKLKKKKTLTLF